MESLGKLEGSSASNDLEKFSIDGSVWVLKSADADVLENERAFMSVMAENGLPVLATKETAATGPEALLLEYVEGSPTLSKCLDHEVAREWGLAVRKMHSISAGGPSYYAAGSLHPRDWQAFLCEEIRQAEERQRRKKGGLPERDVVRFRELT